LKTSPSETFIHELRSALNHLYDPDYLRGSPLAVILGVDRRFDTPSALQGILTRAIEVLKPASNAANKIYARSIYDLLLFRYVQQFNQNEIANQLGISVRHLRRQQNLAIYELAGRLWDQYQLGAPGQTEAVQAVVDQSPLPDQFTKELVWLKHPSSQVATDLSLALEAVHLLIHPYAEQKKAQLIFPTLTAGLAQVHPVAFQQIILTLLTYAIQSMPGQEILVEVQENQGWQSLVISTGLPDGSSDHFPTSSPPAETTDPGSLETVKKMVELSEGAFSIQAGGKTFHAQVAFRSVIPMTVLVIDDNPEIITMMQRFVAETRYQIVGLNDPSAAIEYALKMKPGIIVIDIMMPQVDGLQVLSRFKHHPALGRLPVIICSVLPQKNLSASLGAVDFIQKPIQREIFINAIEKASTPT
jgi:CheY-like chemotaxis protein